MYYEISSCEWFARIASACLRFAFREWWKCVRDRCRGSIIIIHHSFRYGVYAYIFRVANDIMPAFMTHTRTRRMMVFAVAYESVWQSFWSGFCIRWELMTFVQRFMMRLPECWTSTPSPATLRWLVKTYDSYLVVAYLQAICMLNCVCNTCMLRMAGGRFCVSHIRNDCSTNERFHFR